MLNKTWQNLDHSGQDVWTSMLHQKEHHKMLAWVTKRLNGSWQSDVAQPEVEVFLEANGPQDDLCHDWLTHFSSGFGNLCTLARLKSQ